MSNKNGNPEALARWRASLTPEQKASAQKKSWLARKRNSLAGATQRSASDRVVAFTVQERRNGKYEPGHSRTLSIYGCPIPLDDLSDWLEAQIRLLRSKGTAVEKPKTSKTLSW